MSLLNSRRFAPDMRMAIVHTLAYFERHPRPVVRLGRVDVRFGGDSEVAIGTLAWPVQTAGSASSKIRSFICYLFSMKNGPNRSHPSYMPSRYIPRLRWNATTAAGRWIVLIYVSDEFAG